MKKILSLVIILGFSFLLTGCGGPDETWNGVYTNGSDYSILIYTADNEKASIAVMQKGENFTFYPVEYPNYLKVSEKELTTIMGEPVKVVKDGNEEYHDWSKTFTIKKFKFTSFDLSNFNQVETKDCYYNWNN